MSKRRFAMGQRAVDLDRAEIRGPDGVVPLTPNEVKLLALLAERPGQVVDRDELLCAALGYRKAVASRAIDQAVWRLRRKLEEEPHQPRWLLSEANVGYRLMLEPPALQGPPGRRDELARLLALLDAHPVVWVVGLPGAGRRALARAAAEARGWRIDWRGDEATLAAAEGSARGIRVATAMPPAGSPALRLGPLRPDDAAALLIGAVLAARGASRLSEDEEAEAARVAARAGHHPATMLAYAEGAVLSRIGLVPTPPADPAIRALVDGLDPELRVALRCCAAFPDPFRAAEVGVPGGLLERLWRSCALDAADTEAGDRLLVVPPCVRVAAPLVRTDPEAIAFVERVTAELEPLGLAALDGLDQDDLERIVLRSARLDAALGFAAGEDRLLPAVVARCLANEQLPPALPDLAAARTPEGLACARLVHSFARAKGDPSHAARLASEACQPDAGGHPACAPMVAATALRTAFRMRVIASAPIEALSPIVDALADLAERQRRPIVLASYRHARGLLKLRAGDPDGAHEDLVAALGLYGPRSSSSPLVASNLAAEAARDGRVHEALAWLDRAPIQPADGGVQRLGQLGPSEEARERLRRSTVRLVVGDRVGAARELTLAEMLGAPEPAILLGRGTIALAEARIEDAVVQTESANTRLVRADSRYEVQFTLVLGWARVAQGHPELALALVDGVSSPMSHADYPAQLALLRAAAVARLGRIADARAILAAIAPPAARWWAPTLAIVSALVDDADGAEVDPGALGRELDRGGRVHLVARFALVALTVPH